LSAMIINTKNIHFSGKAKKLLSFQLYTCRQFGSLPQNIEMYTCTNGIFNHYRRRNKWPWVVSCTRYNR